MIRTCRTWMAVSQLQGALIGTGCPGRGTTQTGEPGGKPEAGAPQTPGPDSPKAGRICDSPYAIRRDGPRELRTGIAWRLEALSATAVRRDGARSDNKQPSIAARHPAPQRAPQQTFLRL